MATKSKGGPATAGLEAGLSELMQAMGRLPQIAPATLAGLAICCARCYVSAVPLPRSWPKNRSERTKVSRRRSGPPRAGEGGPVSAGRTAAGEARNREAARRRQRQLTEDARDIGTTENIAALLTSTVIVPKASRAAVAIRLTEVSSAMSVWTAIASRPSSRSDAATFSAVSPSRSATTTLAPSAARRRA